MSTPSKPDIADETEARLWCDAYLAGLNANALFAVHPDAKREPVDPELIADAAVLRLRMRRTT